MRLEQELKQLGLGLISWAILGWIVREPGLSAAELGPRTFVTQQAVSLAIAGLTRRELVVTASRPGHGRVRELRATDEGVRLAQEGAAKIMALEERLIGALGRPDAARLLEALRRCQQALVSARDR